MIVSLPDSPQAIADASWPDHEPLYESLAVAPIDDPQAWLREWSKLEEIIEEAGTLAMIAYTCDTADPAKEATKKNETPELGERRRAA